MRKINYLKFVKPHDIIIMLQRQHIIPSFFRIKIHISGS